MAKHKPNPRRPVPSLGDAATLPPSVTDVGNADTMQAPISSQAPVVITPLEATSKRYEVEGELARGGLGRILKARDKRLNRPVAIKQLLQKLRGHERFEFEALTTAKLQHPAIVPVYEAGVWEDGEPYFAMKLVSGRPFDEVIRDTKNLDERLVLLPRVIDICDAMAYAHSKGIIHRDLKPQNILIGEFGETVVIDWGLAKEIGESDQKEKSALPLSTIHSQLSTPPTPSSPQLTQAGAVMGTPSYMPPEQAKALPVDARADVYSLGAILYHLLSGQAPYQGKSSIEVLKELSSAAPAPLARLQQGIPPDLITLVDKAMSRAPEDRYPSAKELAEELRRFQNGQLVLSHHYGGWERFRRFIMRNKVAMVVGLISSVVIAIGEISLFRTNNALHASEKALQKENEANKQYMIEKTQQSEVLRLGMVSQTVRLAKEQLSTDPRATLMTLLDAWKPEMQKLSEAQWREVRHIAAEALALPLPRTITKHEGLIFATDISLNGELIATGGVDGIIRVTPTKGGKSQELFEQGKVAVNDLGISGDGAYLFSTSLQGPLRRWNLSTGKAQIFHPGKHLGFRLSEDRSQMSVLMVGGELILLDPTSGEEKQHFPEKRGENYVTCFSSDGAHLALGSTEGVIFLWDSSAQKITRLEGHSTETTNLLFSHDNKELFSADDTGEIRRWDVATGQGAIFAQTSPELSEISLSASDRWLAGSIGLNLWAWDLSQKNSAPLVLQGHHTLITSLGADPHGERFVAADDEGVIRLWDMASRASTPFLGHKRTVWGVGFSPDGKYLLSAGYDGDVLLWSPKPASPLLKEPLRGRLFSIDGSTALLMGEANTLYFYERAQDQLTAISAPSENFYAYQISPNNAWVSTIDESKAWQLYDTRQKHSVELPSQAAVERVAFSPDSRSVLYAEEDGALFIWEIESNKKRLFLNEHEKISALLFSPDGSSIAVGRVGSVSIVDAMTGITQKKFTAPIGLVRGLAFSPTGGELAVGGSDGKIRFYQTSLGQEQTPAELIAHETMIIELKYSPNGEGLLSIDLNSNAKLWELESGVKRQEANGLMLGKKIASAYFSLDSKKLYLLTLQGALVEETNDTSRDPEILRAVIEQRLSGL
jgi:WD40 repeat protein/serine/threonine protein kinase